MSATFYSRGAEDRKPVSIHDLHKVRYGIVTVGAAQRQQKHAGARALPRATGPLVGGGR